MILLFLEMLAFGLAIPVMIQLAGISAAMAVSAVGGTALLCLLSGGLFRTSIGYPLGWLAQLAGLALGLLHPVMFFIGGIFAFLYVLSFVLGRKIDRLPRQHEGAH